MKFEMKKQGPLAKVPGSDAPDLDWFWADVRLVLPTSTQAYSGMMLVKQDVEDLERFVSDAQQFEAMKDLAKLVPSSTVRKYALMKAEELGLKEGDSLTIQAVDLIRFRLEEIGTMGEDPWIVWFSRLVATLAAQDGDAARGTYSRAMIDSVMADAPIPVKG